MILIKVTIAVWMIFILASGRAIWLYIRNQKKGMNDEEYYSHLGEWEISLNELPEQYRQYAREIDVVFNSCVRHGCCGGCS